jgi:hypothetical protein
MNPERAWQLRSPSVLPAEQMTIRVVKEGKEMARASAIWMTEPWSLSMMRGSV